MAVFCLVLLPLVVAAQDANLDAILKRANDAPQHGDFVAAISDYRKVLELRPNDVEARVNLGDALAHIGKYDEPIEICRSALPSLEDKNIVLLNLPRLLQERRF